MEEQHTGLTPGAAPTSPADYPGWQPPEPHTLPSGAVFLLQRPQVMKMVRQGQIPNPLMDVVNEVFEERDEAEIEALAEERGITVEEMRAELAAEEEAQDAENPKPPHLTGSQGLAFGDVMVYCSIVQPEIEFEPALPGSPLTANGKLAYESISDPDFRYILNWANMEVASLRQFRQEPGDEAAGDDGGAVRDTAELASGAPV